MSIYVNTRSYRPFKNKWPVSDSSSSNLPPRNLVVKHTEFNEKGCFTIKVFSEPMCGKKIGSEFKKMEDNFKLQGWCKENIVTASNCKCCPICHSKFLVSRTWFIRNKLDRVTSHVTRAPKSGIHEEVSSFPNKLKNTKLILLQV